MEGKREKEEETNQQRENGRSITRRVEVDGLGKNGKNERMVHSYVRRQNYYHSTNQMTISIQTPHRYKEWSTQKSQVDHNFW
jgi:hypothetical protein